ncbi:MAG: twin-arginine translocase subunit TatC [Bacteroidales bacterium]|nr:twin-arginine translocase subunit TatC [Bacteroidales bacterium]
MAEKEEGMSFWDHLDALRVVLFRVVGIWLVLTILFFIIMPSIFDTVILGPCHRDFIFYQWIRDFSSSMNIEDDFLAINQNIELQNINLTAPFLIRCSTSFMLAVIVTVPFLLWEVWKFVQPALYPHEQKGIKKAMLLGSGMFFIGVSIGYFVVFPITLRFLANYELSTSIVTMLSLNSYMDNFMMLVICMGLAFELPLVTWLLSLIGLLKRSMLRKYRRHAIVAIVVLAAIITPTSDPFTLSIVSLPLCLLYELSIFLVKKD